MDSLIRSFSLYDFFFLFELGEHEHVIEKLISQMFLPSNWHLFNAIFRHQKNPLNRQFTYRYVCSLDWCPSSRSNSSTIPLFFL
ncbi:Uncharacterized protein APZ42_028273 [Daphnia magna]|uniref:Uncharacterized protein n=1 Tax=Daphnia magna TaxID=35525 RepID=A0A164QMF1_9CRUS|nr:Uncharacterized protein APZ42_028273 [Daphnia magna]